MIRRYVGRATGARRKPKTWKRFYPWSFWSLPTLFIATGAMTAILAAVWIINPGSNTPGEEKGSQPTAGVTPASESASASASHGTRP